MVTTTTATQTPIQTGTQTGTGGNTSSATSKSQVTGDLQTFLKMLTAQIRNQDPLKPIESSDFAAQLATFSGVEQQVKTNQLLESLAGQMGLSGISQMAGWVGMEARVSAPVAFDGSPVTLVPEPTSGADQAMVVVLDASGREVLRQTVTPSSEPMVWSGTDGNGAIVPNGQYSFRLDSYQNGKVIGSGTLDAYGRVTEIRNGASGPAVVLQGGAEVAASAVKSLRAPAG